MGFAEWAASSVALQRKCRPLYGEQPAITKKKKIVLYSLDSAIVDTFKNRNSVQLLYPLSSETALII